MFLTGPPIHLLRCTLKKESILNSRHPGGQEMSSRLMWLADPCIPSFGPACSTIIMTLLPGTFNTIGMDLALSDNNQGRTGAFTPENGMRVSEFTNHVSTGHVLSTWIISSLRTAILLSFQLAMVINEVVCTLMFKEETNSPVKSTIFSSGLHPLLDAI